MDPLKGNVLNAMSMTGLTIEIHDRLRNMWINYAMP